MMRKLRSGDMATGAVLVYLFIYLFIYIFPIAKVISVEWESDCE